MGRIVFYKKKYIFSIKILKVQNETGKVIFEEYLKTATLNFCSCVTVYSLYWRFPA